MSSTRRKRISVGLRSLLTLIVVIAAAIALFIIGLKGAFYFKPEMQIENRVQVERKTIDVVSKITGTLQAAYKVEVKSKVGGPIVGIFAQEGALVSKGDKILQIDDYEASRQLQVAKSRYEQAKAEYEIVQAKQSSTVIARLETDIQLAHNQMMLDEDEYKKIKGLYAKGYASERELIESKAAVEASQARVKQAELDLNSARATWPAEQKVLESSVEQAKSEYEIAATQLADCIVKAPVNGYVLSMALSVGDTAVPSVGGQPGGVLAVIGNTKDLIVKLQLSENLIAQVHRGQSVEINYRGLDKPFKGEIASLSRYGDISTGTVLFPAVIRVLSPPTDVFLGTTVEITVRLGRAENVLAVPVEAVHNGAVTRVLAGNTYSEVIVQLGISDGTYVEVKSGLAEGDEIIISQPKPNDG
jgi:HlyD family secretion protein